MGNFQTGITIKKGILSNSSALPNQDFISGFIAYDASLPSAWPASGVVECLSLQDAVNAGITGNHEDETAASGVLAMVGASGAGLTLNVYVQEPYQKVLLCSYTTVSGDTVAGTFATNLTAAINAAKGSNGGYSALASVSSVDITARPGLGVFLNSGSPITVTGTAAGDATITQFASGVASKWDTYYYHISEYFRMNPTGQLWVGLFNIPATYNFTEVGTLQAAANGAIRQVALYVPARTVVSNGATDIASLNAECVTLDTNKQPLVALLAEDIHSVTDLSTLPTLAFSSNYNYVSMNISQDGAAWGNFLYKVTNTSITNIGAMLGVLSSVSVAASIAQPISNNNLAQGPANSYGLENNVPAFANGSLFSAVSINLQTQLNNYNYIYSGSYTGYNGTYFSGDQTCSLSNSNYAYIYQNRVENKIERLMYVAYLPYLNGGITLNSDGTIYGPQVEQLNGVGDNALSTMISAGELSQVQTAISPTQNVTANGKLIVTLYEINIAVTRNIEIDINSVTSL